MEPALVVGLRDPHQFWAETMKTTTTTLLDEVLPEFDVEVFSGWLQRDFLRKQELTHIQIVWMEVHE